MFIVVLRFKPKQRQLESILATTGLCVTNTSIATCLREYRNHIVDEADIWAIIIAAGLSLYHRVPVKVDVIRDRATLSAISMT